MSSCSKQDQCFGSEVRNGAAVEIFEFLHRGRFVRNHKLECLEGVAVEAVQWPADRFVQSLQLDFQRLCRVPHNGVDL